MSKYGVSFKFICEIQTQHSVSTLDGEYSTIVESETALGSISQATLQFKDNILQSHRDLEIVSIKVEQQ